MPDPSTSATGTTLPESLFDPVADPSTSTEGISQAPEEPNLTLKEFPPTDPVWDKLNPHVVDGKVPAGKPVRTTVTRVRTYRRPKKPFSPESVIPPYCEIYKLTRDWEVHVRKYIVLAGNDAVQFHHSVTPYSYTAWVLVCTGQEPRLLRESLEDKFSDTPPPLTDPYYWRPPQEIDVSREDFMAGWAGPRPEDLKQQPGCFYDVRLIFQLQLPTRFEGCILVATYRRAFKVRRTCGTDVSVYTVTLEGDIVRRIQIPECPRVPQGAWKLENPRRFANGLLAGGSAAVMVGSGDDWHSMKLSALSSGALRVTGDVGALLVNGPQVRVRTVAATGLVREETTAASEWSQFVARGAPAWTVAELRGALKLAADGSGTLEIESAQVTGVFRHGLSPED